MSNRFLNAATVIESLRDNGYNNTAYALAELIDNSLQAKATRVEVGFIEKQQDSKAYTVSEISLWDNGIGMSPETLQIAMQFGGGIHRNDNSGMGKFGMGLPNSSISQCKRVDVWSWEKGKETYHTYLDIEAMKSGDLEIVPTPAETEIPPEYQQAFFPKKPESGTLVIWSQLDRLSWKTGRSIFKHCEFLVGRMYRNFISNEEVKLESITYRKATNNCLDIFEQSSFKANDPMYLLKNTSLDELPGDYKEEAFFELFDEEDVQVKFINDEGIQINETVTIKTSIVKNNIAKEILQNKSNKQRLGATKWGRHCKKNIGVSLVRAGRELVIRDTFLTSALRETKGRFIGIEVLFPPSLDAIFGVTNNKQDAVKIIPYELGEISSQAGFDSEQEYIQDLKDNNDHLLHTLQVVKAIKRNIQNVSKGLESVSVEPNYKPTGEDGGIQPSKAEDAATAGSAYREGHGHETDGFNVSLNEKEIKDFLEYEGVMTSTEAGEAATRIVKSGVKYLIESVARDSDAFFDVSTRKGLTLVMFNTNHVFYKKLLSKLPENELDVMQTTIAGFARVMNETSDEKRLAFLNTTRREWGKIITEFLVEPTDDLDDF